MFINYLPIDKTGEPNGIDYTQAIHYNQKDQAKSSPSCSKFDIIKHSKIIECRAIAFTAYLSTGLTLSNKSSGLLTPKIQ